MSRVPVAVVAGSVALIAALPPPHTVSVYLHDAYLVVPTRALPVALGCLVLAVANAAARVPARWADLAGAHLRGMAWLSGALAVASVALRGPAAVALPGGVLIVVAPLLLVGVHAALAVAVLRRRAR